MSDHKFGLPLVCPACGNSDRDDGITLVWLEWRLAPVAGRGERGPIVDFEDQDFASVEPRDGVRASTLPDVTEADLEHLFCNRCDHRWPAWDTEDANDHKREETP